MRGAEIDRAVLEIDDDPVEPRTGHDLHGLDARNGRDRAEGRALLAPLLAQAVEGSEGLRRSICKTPFGDRNGENYSLATHGTNSNPADAFRRSSKSRRHCEPDNGSAKQSILPFNGESRYCFASLAMTEGMVSRSRGTDSARALHDNSPTLSKKRGRRECRMRAAPAVSCAMCTRSAHTSIQVQRRTSDIPCAMAFTAYNALSPVSLLLPLVGGTCRRRQPRGVRTTRLCRTLQPRVRRSLSVHRITRPSFVTTADAPLGGTGWR